MTISNENVKQVFNGTGLLTAFPFSIIYFAIQDAEIEVYLRDEAVSPVTETLLTITTHYTMVDGATDGYRYDGGTINMVTAPALTEKLIVKRKLNLRQDSFSPSPTTPYQPEEVEITFDKTIAKTQQVDEEVDRTLKLSLGTAVIDSEIPDGAGKFIKFNAAGTGFEVDDIDLAAQQSQIDSNTANIATNTAGIAANLAADAAQDANIAQNAADIASNTGLIGNNAAAISTNAGNITTNANAIAVLEARVSALEAFLGVTDNQLIFNNTAIEDITAMIFDSAVTSSVIIDFFIARKTGTGSKYTSGLLYVVWSEATATWRIEKGLEILDYAGVTFDVVTAGNLGQVNYTSGDLTGTGYTGDIHFNIRKFGV